MTEKIYGKRKRKSWKKEYKVLKEVKRERETSF